MFDFVSRTLILWFAILSLWGAAIFGSVVLLFLCIFFGGTWLFLTIKDLAEKEENEEVKQSANS